MPANKVLRPWVLLPFLAAIYFVAFPDDLGAVIAPLERLLSLTQAVSGWLYAFAAVCVVCWTALRIWGRPPSTSP